MDELLRFNENTARAGMQAVSHLLNTWGAFLSINPFMQPWAQSLSDSAQFFKIKSNKISSWPWHTKNRVVYRGTKTALRRFSRGNNTNAVLFVPPEAGHNSQIVDFGPGQSLVQCALDHFAGDVYVMEKLPSRPEDANYSLEDSIRSLDQCVQHIAKPVHLVGLCQGGWQATIYTALFTEKVNTLTLAGAPIDFHAGEGRISQLARSLPLSFYQHLVDLGNGLMPGAFITAGFKMMNAFDRFFGDDVNLYRNISDRPYVDRHLRFSRWYDYTQSLSGRMYLEVVENLFKENKLVKGLLEVMGQRVDLGRIYHPLYLIAGSKDDITPPDQLFALEDYVSSEPIWKKTAQAGHIGVFMASTVIDSLWTDLFKRLSRRKSMPKIDDTAIANAPCAYAWV